MVRSTDSGSLLTYALQLHLSSPGRPEPPNATGLSLGHQHFLPCGACCTALHAIAEAAYFLLDVIDTAPQSADTGYTRDTRPAEKCRLDARCRHDTGPSRVEF